MDPNYLAALAAAGVPNPGNYFVYEAGPFNVPQNAALATQSIQILDAPFKWILAVATSTGVFSCLIRSSGTKRPFSNQQVHSSNFFGTAQNPMPLVTPYTFQQKDSILIDLTDLSNSNPNVVRVGFIGVELA